MPVVPAGVHPAGLSRAVWDVVRLLDGKRIHVGADENAPARSLGRAVALGQDTGLADARSDGVSELLQPLRDERAGASLLEAELGVLMQVAPGGDERGAVDGGHSHGCTLHDDTLPE